MFSALATLLLAVTFFASHTDAYVPSIAAQAGFGNTVDAAAALPGGLIVIEWLAGAVVFLFIFTPSAMIGPLFTRSRHMTHDEQVAVSKAIGVGFFGPTAQMIFGAIRMLGQLAGVTIFTGYVLHCFAIADNSCYDWAGQ